VDQPPPLDSPPKPPIVEPTDGAPGPSFVGAQETLNRFTAAPRHAVSSLPNICRWNIVFRGKTRDDKDDLTIGAPGEKKSLSRPSPLWSSLSSKTHLLISEQFCVSWVPLPPRTEILAEGSICRLPGGPGRPRPPTAPRSPSTPPPWRPPRPQHSSGAVQRRKRLALFGPIASFPVHPPHIHGVRNIFSTERKDKSLI